jgi:catalase
MLLGIGAVGAFLVVDLGAIAYANNWIGSDRFSRQAIIDRFQSIFGLHPGFRPVLARWRQSHRTR